ncbi:MAG TPA: DUF5615 family PIN-like protein [Steroidobacteraceae bacterium]
MRILFDQGVPAPLREHLTKHTVTTTSELGWHQLKNGELLSKAEEAGYEIFVTTDQNLKYQHNLPVRKLAIAVLMTTSWPRIAKNSPQVVQQIDALLVGAYMEIHIP